MLLAGSAYQSAAINTVAAGLEIGLKDVMGGCSSKGVCSISPLSGSGDGTISYDAGTNELWITVPNTSAFYGSLYGETIEYEGSSYFPADISEGLGFGSATVYVPAGIYNITENANGDRIVQLSYVIEN